MIEWLYNVVFIPALSFLSIAGGFFSEKFSKRQRGIQQTWKILEKLPSPTASPRLWVHASSMGEFEQTKNILERIKAEKPNVEIIASFFSPSGFEHQKKYLHISECLYLPLDSRNNAKKFITLLRPDFALFARYDAWLHYLSELHSRQIPAILICATMPPNSPYLHPVFLGFTQKMYGFFQKIYTAGTSETEIFEHYHLNKKIVTAADTRFDHIAGQVKKAKNTRILPDGFFKENDLVLAIGSSWELDEKLILSAIKKLRQSGKNIRFIIAPHEPTEENVARLLKEIPEAIRLSSIDNKERNWDKTDIIVDSVGKLLGLYAYAHAAYIGGGFGTGVHSVTEPAGYGIPLASGTRIERARDAVALHNIGALTVISTTEECSEWLENTVFSHLEREKQGILAQRYIQQSTGYSEVIAKNILGVFHSISR